MDYSIVENIIRNPFVRLVADLLFTVVSFALGDILGLFLGLFDLIETILLFIFPDLEENFLYRLMQGMTMIVIVLWVLRDVLINNTFSNPFI